MTFLCVGTVVIISPLAHPIEDKPLAHSISRTLIYLVVAAIALVFVYSINFNGPYLPSGLLLPASDNIIAANSNDVKVYQSPPLVKYKTVGQINLEQSQAAPKQEAIQALITQAKTIAQKSGANGILITLFAASPNESPKELNIYILQAKAIITQSNS